MLRQNENKRNELIEKIQNEATTEHLGCMVSLVNSYNSGLQDFDVWENDEEFFEVMFETRDDLVRAIAYGEYNYMDEYVRLDAYGNIESLNSCERDEELEKYAKEIIEAWFDLYEENAKEACYFGNLDDIATIVDDFTEEINEEEEK